MPPRSPLETYLRKVQTIRATGGATPETSYYPALDGLLNEIGDGLRPRVHAAGPLRNTGDGLPDAGLFTSHQLQQVGAVIGVDPARGVVEVKAPSVPIERLLDPSTPEGDQVQRYLKRYRGVLVTNYRDFAFIDRNGRAERAERPLARSEHEFWSLAQDPGALDPEAAVLVEDFLSVALRFSVPITEPKELAQALAVYARRARADLSTADIGRLDTLRDELERALGIEFVGTRGTRFFIATVVQTVFYGLFSAWAQWSRDPDVDANATSFEWRRAGDYLRVPVLQDIFDEVTKSGNVRALGIEDHLDRATEVFKRVHQGELFSRFDGEAAIEYFYEPFLEAYDPALRQEFGVWYTPRPLVKYMVERVDTVLRQDLGIEDGLADPSVAVLDPACGTGGFLTAVLDLIVDRLEGQGHNESEVRRAVRFAACKRVIGFEILTAPYAVAHLILSLHLRQRGWTLERGDRAAVYLTNALTGGDAQEKLDFHLKALEEENRAAEEIKRSAPILVVLGNPPYDAYADVALQEEKGLVERYRNARRTSPPKGHGLNDLYVRFFAMAERAIVERGLGYGVVCFVSNSSWLDGLSHTGMRERYLETFSKVWVDDLHGDKYRTGKRIPRGERNAGEPDPSVFSLGGNHEGIQVGTAVSLLFRDRDEDGEADAEVHHRSLWGNGKLVELAETAGEGTQRYDRVDPDESLGLPFVPSTMSAGYTEWDRLPDLFPFYTPGVKTSRDELLVDIDRVSLEGRMAAYFDPAVTDGAMRELSPKAMKSTRTFDAGRTRRHLQRRGVGQARVVPHVYRPFDMRWLFYEPETDLVERKRPEYPPHVFPGNVWFATAQRARKGFEPPLVAESLMSLHVVEWSASCFPLYLNADSGLFGDDEAAGRHGEHRDPVPNLSDRARGYLDDLGVEDEEAPFYHAVAVLHAQAYQDENAGALRLDWPRLPLPGDGLALVRSAAIGRRVAALLDVEHDVRGVTSGAVLHPLRPVAVPSTVDGADPGAGDLAVTARWGRSGRGGAVMPGPGDTRERRLSGSEADAMGDAAGPLCGPELGTVDVYLNERTYWRNVPVNVWEYRMGGYQVLKKWLSYRERDVLGRDLAPEEAVWFTHAARRIGALLLLAGELNENYADVIEGVPADESVLVEHGPPAAAPVTRGAS